MQDASVLGKTFPPDTLATLTGRDENAVRGSLEGLVRREFLADPIGRAFARTGTVRIPPVPDAARRVRDVVAA